ncbi:MAG: carbonic anhydrase [Chitinivibrionales bacterium]|nr:carbonic anhydrase [Chitinivibrionales bacterium]MBD3355612.1 carbonic anhydrase [Chitinivibrionales bacterium]
MDHQEVLDILLEGNRRYAEGCLVHPHLTKARRRGTVEGQRPFAAILGCADSRVPPELIFDMGIGDLFVIRVAGNIVDQTVTASIEYAAGHLGVPLVLVLGHSCCGAITAALTGAVTGGHLPCLAAALEPSLAPIDRNSPDAVARAAVAHAGRMAKKLRECSPMLSCLIGRGTLRVASAHYDLATGLVSILDD